MKISKWLWALLFGIGAMQFGVTDDDGGGSDDNNDDDGDKGGAGADDTDGGDDKGSEGDKGDKGGKPTDAEAKLLKEVMDRKKALKAEREEKQKLADQLKQFEGIDPEEVRKLLAEKKDAETKSLEAKGEWDRLKAQMADAHTAEKTALNTKLSESESEVSKLKKTIADLTVGGAFAQSAFIKDELSLTPNKTRVVYGAHFEFDADGRVVGYDKPAGAAQRTMLVDGAGEPLGFEAALRKIVEADPDRDQLLRSKVKPGAASKTDGKGGKSAAAAVTDSLSGKDRIAAALNAGGVKK